MRAPSTITPTAHKIMQDPTEEKSKLLPIYASLLTFLRNHLIYPQRTPLFYGSLDSIIASLFCLFSIRGEENLAPSNALS